MFKSRGNENDFVVRLLFRGDQYFSRSLWESEPSDLQIHCSRYGMQLHCPHGREECAENKYEFLQCRTGLDVGETDGPCSNFSTIPHRMFKQEETFVILHPSLSSPSLLHVYYIQLFLKISFYTVTRLHIVFCFYCIFIFLLYIMLFIFVIRLLNFNFLFNFKLFCFRWLFLF